MPPTHLSTSIRSLVYALKRDFGSPADFYHEASDSVDLGSGVRTTARETVHVRRAIPTPTTIGRKDPYPNALPAIGRTGGTLQLGDKALMVDRRDLPASFAVGTENWFVVVDGRRYEVVDVAQYEPALAYHITLRELAGSELDRDVSVSVRDSVGASDLGTPP